MNYNFVSNIYQVYRSWLFSSYKSAIRSYLLDSSERWVELAKLSQSWRTNLVLPVIQELQDAMYSYCIDSEAYFSVDRAALQDVKSWEPKAVAKYLNYLYNIWDDEFIWNSPETEMLDAINDALLLGNGYLGVVWNKDEESVEYFDWKQNKQVVMSSIDQPSLEYVNPFEIIPDPAARQSIQNWRYLIRRRFMTASEAYDKFKFYIKKWDKKYKVSEVDAIAKEKFMTKMWAIIPWSSMWLIAREDFTLFKNQVILDISSDPTDNILKLSPADDTYEIVEVRTRRDNMYYIYIDWMEVYKWPSAYPFSLYPFWEITYNKLTWSFIWVWIASKCKDLQTLGTAFINLHVDNAKLNNTPAFTKIKTPSSDFFENDATLDIEPMKVFHVEQKDWLTPLKLNSWVWLMSEISLTKEFAQSAVWVSEMIMWQQGKVERSAAWVNAMTSSFKARLKPLYKSISMCMTSIWQMWVMMAIAKSANKDIKINVKQDDWIYKIETLKVEDLIWRWKIRFEVAWLTVLMKEVERKQLQEILPVAVKLIDNATWMPLFNTRKLAEKMIEIYNWDNNMLLTPEELVKLKSEADKVIADAKAQELAAKWWWAAPWAPWQLPAWWPEWWAAPWGVAEQIAKLAWWAPEWTPTEEWQWSIPTWVEWVGSIEWNPWPWANIWEDILRAAMQT